MNRDDAIKVLIGFAVCASPKLHCDTDCPFYMKTKDEKIISDCKYVDNEFELEEAVKVLNGGINNE